MKRASLGKMCAHFLELSFLKCNGNAVFFFKNTRSKEKGPFLFEKLYFLSFGGCPYFLYKTLDKVYNKQLRSYNPTN